MNESDITSNLCHYLRQDFKAIVFKLHGHAMQQPGIPDFYICHPLFEGWIEAKKDKNKLSPLQYQIMSSIIQCGGNAFVLRYWADEFFAQVEDIMGNNLAIIRYTKWSEFAEKLLDTLYGLRKNSQMQSKADP